MTREYVPLDISSHVIWAKPPTERDLTFAQLRAERRISW